MHRHCRAEARAAVHIHPGRVPAEAGMARKMTAMAKILYVEDNEDNIYMLTRRLSRRGYEVVVATDGEQGIAMARSEAPALILMDLSLPVLDGWEATRQLKAAAETRDIPVIALSAHAMSGEREKALAAGCNDYLPKPVDLPALLTKIEELLP